MRKQVVMLWRTKINSWYIANLLLQQKMGKVSFFLFDVFFFPFSLPQIQLGLFVFFLHFKVHNVLSLSLSLSLFSIDCAFLVSFPILMFALKFLLLNKSDWKCRTIENSILWQGVSNDSYLWRNLESHFVFISHNCSTNVVLFHFQPVYYI